MRATTVLIGAALALGFGTAEAADEWGIEYEEEVRFEAKVVDILCELSGDCPADCGGGKRVLGLLREDGRLVLAAKNTNPFAGAVVDLAPFCGKTVIVDGLIIDNPRMPMFVVQYKSEAPDGEWSGGNWFGKDWARTHGVALDSETARLWFRNDPRVIETIERDGVFGIPGLEPEE